MAFSFSSFQSPCDGILQHLSTGHVNPYTLAMHGFMDLLPLFLLKGVFLYIEQLFWHTT